MVGRASDSLCSLKGGSVPARGRGRREEGSREGRRTKQELTPTTGLFSRMHASGLRTRVMPKGVRSKRPLKASLQEAPSSPSPHLCSDVGTARARQGSTQAAASGAAARRASRKEECSLWRGTREPPSAEV